MKFSFPKIYPILDSSFVPVARRAEFLRRLGSELGDAGVTLMEYRNKNGSDAEVLADARILRQAMPKGSVKLVLDDRAGLVGLADFDGVHVDAGDVSPAEARKIVGADGIVGTFGGNEALLPGILETPANYFSIGPVFKTVTKQTTKPLIGLEGVRRQRTEAGPEPVLVAVGGVKLDTAAEILAAGASVIAIAGALFRAADPAAEFRRWKAALG